MNTMLRAFAVAVVGAMLAMPARAQVPDGHLVVASFSAAGAPGVGGIYTIDPNAAVPAWTPVTGLPPALATAANCVVRDPATEHLIVGNLSPASGGTTDAFVLGLNGHAATVLHSVHLGNGGGVHGVALLPGGDVVLAIGNLTSGPVAGQPLVRWTPTTGALTPIVLGAAYGAGNWANAVLPYWNGLLVGILNGSSGLWEVIEVPLAGGPSNTIWTGLSGEFPTQLAGDGRLHVATSRQPFATNTGRVVTFGAGPWPTGWWQSGVLLGGGRHFNALVYDRPQGRLFTSGQLPATFGLDEIVAGNVVPLAAGPGGVISGIDINPNPEVFEAPSGAAWAHWLGASDPVVGNQGFTLSYASGGGMPFVFADFARTPGVSLLGIDVFLPATAVALPTPLVPCTQTGIGILCDQPMPLPAQTSLIGLGVFVQVAMFDGVNLGASDLLQFTIR